MRVFGGALTATTMLVLAGCSTTTLNPNYQQTTKYKGSNPYASQEMPLGYEDAAVVQQAGYQTQVAAPITYAAQQNTRSANYLECVSKESNRKILGAAAGGIVGAIAGRKIAGDNKTLGTVAGAAIGGAAGHGIADKTIACDRALAVVRQTAPVYKAVPQAVTYEAPVEAQAPVLVPASGIQENTASVGANGTPGYYAVNGIAPPAQAVKIVPQQVQPQLAQIQPSQPQQVQPSTQKLLGPKTYTVPVSAMTARHIVKAGDTLYSLARTTCSTVVEIQGLNTINSKFYIRVGDEILLPSGRCAE